MLFMFLLALSMFIVTLTGMNLFGMKYVECSPDYNEGSFDSLFSSFALVFRVLTLDDWNAIAFGAVECMEFNWVILFYFLLWLVLGNFMLLNLFLAILIRSFERMKDKKEAHRKEMEAQAAEQAGGDQSTATSTDTTPAATPLQAARQLKNMFKKTATPVAAARKLRLSVTSKPPTKTTPLASPILQNATRRLSAVSRAFVPPPDRDRAPSIRTDEEEVQEEHVREEVDHAISIVGKTLTAPFRGLMKLMAEDTSTKDIAQLREKGLSTDEEGLEDEIEATMRGIVAASGDKATMLRHMTRERNETVDKPHSELVDFVPIHGVSLNLFSHSSTFRIICHEIAHHRVFNNFILLCIVASSVCLALETPDISPEEKDNLILIDHIFT
jgi:hypothetical protein